ncbi:MAG TPA: 1-deoxy-D-xylulose-5-phosphate synthase N-terminal domain-containing protein [Candidatus Acidoferrales bacterium]|nr:1-deoxy-D-xylulose-5-phosphate synthase N-terminal domain-containing protein [Candidatus Acidoferrales bacterium]
MQHFSLKKLTRDQKKLRKRILKISHESRLSHLGSCLSAIDLIDTIYKVKKKDEKFILSNGHAGIAWYAVLEKYGYIQDANSIKNLHVHPDRNTQLDIHVSTGSLGQGLPIALGMALADRKRQVYCMLSDGECAEGSIWEALRIAVEKKVTNLKIIINANGWSAYDKVNLTYLSKRIKAFGFIIHKVNGHDNNHILKKITIGQTSPTVLYAYTTVEQFPFLTGQDAHYYTMTDEDYTKAKKLLS